MSLVEVYRLHDAHDIWCGVYRAAAGYNVIDGKAREHRPCWRVDASVRGPYELCEWYETELTMHYRRDESCPWYFGFPSKQAVCEWFSPRERSRLQAHGIVLTKLYAHGDWYKSDGKQCAFHRDHYTRVTTLEYWTRYVIDYK